MFVWGNKILENKNNRDGKTNISNETNVVNRKNTNINVNKPNGKDDNRPLLSDFTKVIGSINNSTNTTEINNINKFTVPHTQKISTSISVEGPVSKSSVSTGTSQQQ